VLWSTLLAAQFGLIVALGAYWISPTAAHTAVAKPPVMASMDMAHMAAQAPQKTLVALHQRVVRLTIHNFAFQPARLVVSPGTRLVWTNTDSDPHTVDSTKNVWSSEALDTNSTFARVFSKIGTFPYYCSIHPFMHGTIVVQK
jgi:plastocyanin